jgi:hypothetical protein
MLSLEARHRQRLRRHVTVFAACDEACTLRAVGTLRLPGAVASRAAGLIAATGSGKPGTQLRLRVKLRRKVLRLAKQARKDGARLKTRVRVTATDPSGNSATRAIRIALR